ncbi:uncharacterized protein [Coffea arabica]|uniref:RNase H type-1 domain-containing protein n=1 Tax=Coffea arabica TaxID=13443 RepID=A0ABM4UFF7_COFAR
MPTRSSSISMLNSGVATISLHELRMTRVFSLRARTRFNTRLFVWNLFAFDCSPRVASRLDFSLPQLQLEDNEALQIISSSDEIKAIVFSLSADGALGPDGFGVGFYQLLPKLISPWQADFVPGHCISDNLLLAQELAIDLDKRLNHPNLILKLDMEKAYDRFSILINGVSSDFFKSSRGVRQGDPLSLALFVLMVECFTRDDILVFVRCSEDCVGSLAAFFVQVLTKMWARLGSWSAKLLSAGGKLILLKHVLSSLPMCLLQVLRPPKAIFIKLERICNAFLWDHGVESQRVHWSAWEKLCFPTVEGGLGFRFFEDMCSTFACKFWWRLRTNDSIWATFVHQKYVKGVHPTKATVHRPPHSWQRSEEISFVRVACPTSLFAIGPYSSPERGHFSFSVPLLSCPRGVIFTLVSHRLGGLRGLGLIQKSLAHNQARYEGTWFQAQEVIAGINSFVKQLGRAGVLIAKHFMGDLEHPWAPRICNSSKRVRVFSVAWSRPLFNQFKLNTDASVSGTRASRGGLVHDHTGGLIFAFYKKFKEVDTLMAEGVFVEVDSEVLVRLVLSGSPSKWPLCNTLCRIRGLLAVLSSTVRHIFREANSCADKLAGLELHADTVFSSTHQLPLAVWATLHLD